LSSTQGRSNSPSSMAILGESADIGRRKWIVFSHRFKRRRRNVNSSPGETPRGWNKKITTSADCAIQSRDPAGCPTPPTSLSRAFSAWWNAYSNPGAVAPGFTMTPRPWRYTDTSSPENDGNNTPEGAGSKIRRQSRVSNALKTTRSTLEGSSTWQSQPRTPSGLAPLFVIEQQAKVPLRSISSSQLRPYSRRFRAGLARRTNLDSVHCWRKTMWLYQFEYSLMNEPQNFGSDWTYAMQGR
jgi:hypothetical protein